MCGIVGYVGAECAAPILLDGLKRLEYRGYDSAGIAVLDPEAGITTVKRCGKIANLESALDDLDRAPTGSTGIGHTRWATHGAPSDLNAHPHASRCGDVVVAQNGIVENYAELRRELAAEGAIFTSETDTEVIPQLIARALRSGIPFAAALREAMSRLDGASSVVALNRAEPNRVYAARRGAAGGLVVGLADGQTFISSDLPALTPHTSRVYHLHDGDVVIAAPGQVSVARPDGSAAPISATNVDLDPESAAKGDYPHFMLKEIHEQPAALSDTIRGRARLRPPAALQRELPELDSRLRGIERVLIIGMGTSLHAAMIGRWWMEHIAGIPADFDNASEFRYRAPVLAPRTLLVAITQSGETVDTLGAMDEVRRRWGAPLVAVCNVDGSEATRRADACILTRCGPEISVCSTKTFTAALAALYLLACRIGRLRGNLADDGLAARLDDLLRTPSIVERGIERAPRIAEVARRYARADRFLVLARGIEHPVAMETALKCKEISYAHAEAYAAGEMKHGPIALLDENFPVIALAPRGPLFDKMISAVEQVRARSAPVIAVGDDGDDQLSALADHFIGIPPAPPLLTPFALAPVIQLLSYHLALARGLDIDQPRNLAKTVTVE